MRFGCLGCFVLIVVILTGLVVAGGMLFLSTNIFAVPDVRPVSYSRADGYAAQQKLFEIAQRQGGHSGRKDPVVITDREASAFLANHLTEAGGLPVSSLAVRFSKGSFWAQGKTTLRNLFTARPVTYLLKYIPESRLNQPVWVTLRGKIGVEDGGNVRHGVVTLDELALGRQPLHSVLLYLTMGPSGSGLFRWKVPNVVDKIQLEDGQAIVHTR